jgi:hypothetical protein
MIDIDRKFVFTNCKMFENVAHLHSKFAKSTILGYDQKIFFVLRNMSIKKRVEACSKNLIRKKLLAKLLGTGISG